MKMITDRKPILVYFILIGSCFIFLYYPVFLKLIQSWKNDLNYSHGFFIPFISGFMLWSHRFEISRIENQPSSWGVLILLFGILILLLSWIGSEFFFQGLSMIFVLIGIILFMSGLPMVKKTFLPIIYLVFMIPLPAIIWNKLSFPLALFASGISAELIQLLGLPVLREGNVLNLPNITLQVVEACSGLRSLVTILALSGLLAFLGRFGWKEKLILFFSAIPVALICNVIRLIITAVIANYFGRSTAEGFIHSFSGVVVFILGLIVLLGVYAIFSYQRHISLGNA